VRTAAAGSLYDALAAGRVDVDRLRQALAGCPLPRAGDGRIVLAVDVTCWLRPEAHTSPARIMCHTYGRGKDQHIGVPGWPYSMVMALETGRSSWTAPLDAVRLAPGDDAAAVTADQLRRVVGSLIDVGHWRTGDPDMLIVVDAGYDGPRLAFVLADLPVRVLVRMRSDRVLRRAVTPREPGTRGRSCRHGGEFAFGDPATWTDTDVEISTDTRLYGPARVRAWDRLHPRLTHRTAWTEHAGYLPVLEGTVIRLEVDRLPSGAVPKPVWLGHSHLDLTPDQVEVLWQAFLRRFDIEHLPHAQADPGLDLPETARSRIGGPLDMAGTGRLHPVAAGSWHRSGSAPAVGETPAAAPVDASPGTTRVPAPARQTASSSGCTEIIPVGSRTSGRPTQPASGYPSRRARGIRS
jgi:DDE superfamily endonuclease